jgi:hypothetical protein
MRKSTSFSTRVAQYATNTTAFIGRQTRAAFQNYAKSRYRVNCVGEMERDALLSKRTEAVVKCVRS